MLETLILNFQTYLNVKFRAHFSGKNWDWKFASLLILGLWLWSFPSYQYFFQPEPFCQDNWDALVLQFQHPFELIKGNTDQHFTQARYRILIPIMGCISGISPQILIVLLPLFGILFFKLMLANVKGLFNSKTIAALMAIGIAATYVGRSFTTDVVGYFDCFAFLFVWIALFSNSRWIIFVTCLASFFVDERALMVSPLIVLFGWYRHQSETSIFKLIVQLRFPLVPVFFSILSAICIRLALSGFCGFGSIFPDSEEVGFAVIRTNYQVLPLLWLSGLGFFWISIFIPVVYLYRMSGGVESVLLLAYLIIGFILCQTVLDVTRSTAYFFPGIMVGHLMVFRFESRQFFIRYLKILTLFSFLLPPLFAIGAEITWQGPIIPKALKIISMWLRQ